MWPTDPYIFSKNVYHFFLGGLSDVWNSGHGETRWCCKQEIRESNKNEDNKRVKINLSLYRKPEEANKKTFSRARFLLIHSLIWSHYFRLLQWIKVLKILIIIINFNIHPKPYRYSYPTADYRLLNNLLRNRLAARRDYILFSSLPSCYIPLQVVPFPSSQSVLTLFQQRSRGVQYREGTVDTAKRWTWSLLRFHGASSGNTSHGRQP